MSEKKQTYTVLHDGGEDVGEKNVRPYETFQSVPSKEIDAKVEKGFLAKGELSAAEKKLSRVRNKRPLKRLNSKVNDEQPNK